MGVAGEGDKKRWTKIGAAWAHNDCEGMNLKFDYLPTEPNPSIAIRTPKEREAAK